MDDGMDGWKGRPDTIASGQNQGYYISRFLKKTFNLLGKFFTSPRFASCFFLLFYAACYKRNN